MRLSTNEIDAIKESFYTVFEEGVLYLFGSRVDDTKKGGDIDLYIIPSTQENLSMKKIKFLALLKRIIGEQKIDVVIDRGQDRAIDRVAKNNGILLCKI